MDSDSEYEYEYHESATESFYLNLDLSSLHGPLRPPRRRQPSVSLGEPEDDTHSNPPVVINNNNNNTSTPLDSAETEPLPAEQIQILGLHTSNPIVSYYNQMFSCSWADQIGTELIFSSPDGHLDPDNLTPPLRRGPAFELLAANNVKILGRKANLTSSSGAGLAQDADESTAGSMPFAEVTEAPGVPRRAAVSSNQARFVEQLQSIKTAKGETDTVRTVMSTRRNVNLAERLRGWARTEEQLAHIQRLNEQARDGDTEAWMALQRLFAQLNRTETASTEGSSPQS